MSVGSSQLRIVTPSRLHFGLLLPGAGEPRRFGGLGLALTQPRFVIEAQAAPAWEITGHQCERAEQCLRQVLRQPALAGITPLHVHIAEGIPPHVGLGSGTQLALGLAWLLAYWSGLRPGLLQLLQWSGRGSRSAIGAAAFASGGLILDFGQRPSERIAPTYLRFDFPHQWQVAVLLPRGRPGLHGTLESEVFAQLGPQANRFSERLCRLVMLEIVPSILERDYHAFAQGLCEYNRLAGECFKYWQAGSYHSEMVARIIEVLRQRGPLAVGQSSWGPAVYVIAPAPLLQDVLGQIRLELSEVVDEIVLTSASGSGAYFADGERKLGVLAGKDTS